MQFGNGLWQQVVKRGLDKSSCMWPQTNRSWEWMSCKQTGRQREEVCTGGVKTLRISVWGGSVFLRGKDAFLSSFRCPKNHKANCIGQIIYWCFLSNCCSWHRPYTYIFVRNVILIMLFFTGFLLAICNRRCIHRKYKKLGTCAKETFYCVINPQSRPCKLGNYLYCAYQHFDSVDRSRIRNGVCKITQLFECHFLSMKELVWGMFFFIWNLHSSSTVGRALWGSQ